MTTALSIIANSTDARNVIKLTKMRAKHNHQHSSSYLILHLIAHCWVLLEPDLFAMRYERHSELVWDYAISLHLLRQVRVELAISLQSQTRLFQ